MSDTFIAQLSLSLQYLSLVWAHPILEITHFIFFCLIIYLSKPYFLKTKKITTVQNMLELALQ